MEPLSFTITVGIAAFVATNIDDLLLLAVFFAQRTLPRAAIVAGQFTGIGFLFGVSALAAAISLAVPSQYLAWMGLIPIVLGVKALGIKAPVPGADESTADDDAPDAPRSGRLSVAAVAATTIANGGDNIGVYVPLFATHPPATLLIWGAIFAAMTALWCATPPRAPRSTATVIASYLGCSSRSACGSCRKPGPRTIRQPSHSRGRSSRPTAPSADPASS